MPGALASQTKSPKLPARSRPRSPRLRPTELSRSSTDTQFFVLETHVTALKQEKDALLTHVARLQSENNIRKQQQQYLLSLVSNYIEDSDTREMFVSALDMCLMLELGSCEIQMAEEALQLFEEALPRLQKQQLQKNVAQFWIEKLREGLNLGSEKKQEVVTMLDDEDVDDDLPMPSKPVFERAPSSMYNYADKFQRKSITRIPQIDLDRHPSLMPVAGNKSDQPRPKTKKEKDDYIRSSSPGRTHLITGPSYARARNNSEEMLEQANITESIQNTKDIDVDISQLNFNQSEGEKFAEQFLQGDRADTNKKNSHNVLLSLNDTKRNNGKITVNVRCNQEDWIIQKNVWPTAPLQKWFEEISVELSVPFSRLEFKNGLGIKLQPYHTAVQANLQHDDWIMVDEI